MLTYLAGCSTVRKPAVAVPIEETDLVRSDRLADLLGLSERWVVAGSRLAMDGPTGGLEIESDRREAHARGVRIFLGEPIAAADGQLYVTRTDVERLLLPIFQGKGAKGSGPVRTIALDAGHGGHDNGTMNRKIGLKEKDLTLDVAKRLKAALHSRGFEVIMTRTEDEYVPLARRPQRARGADLFISIHFNATGNSTSSGTETYILTPAGQVSTGTNLSYAGNMAFVTGNRWDGPSAVFCFIVQSGLLKEMGTIDRGLKHARFAVLRDLPCPGILVESAFLSNDAEAARVASDTFRARLAENLAGSIVAYAELAGDGYP
jgi:N-acetylmuramoyl-L-alanine amidase